jgi:hypothetical protein
MTTKRTTIAGVIIALLLSAWGNVIAATFCPRFAADHSCCPKHSSGVSPSHHDMASGDMSADMEAMGDMHMDHTQMPKADQVEPEANKSPGASCHSVAEVVIVLGAPANESCTHCLNHSEPAPGRTSLLVGDPGKSSSEDVPLPTGMLPHSAAFAVEPLPRLDHGPPGKSHSLYVLINVFRI